MNMLQIVAVKCLLNSNISNLPVDVTKLRYENKEWIILSYNDNGYLIDNLGLSEYSRTAKGFTVESNSGVFLIFISNELTYVDRRFVIAHEISHIILEHISSGLILGKSDDPDLNTAQEQEADSLAVLVLANACLIIKEHLTTPYDVSKAAFITEEQAVIAVNETREAKKHRLTKEERALSGQRITRRAKIVLAFCIAAAILAVSAPLWIPQPIHKAQAEEQKYKLEDTVYITPSGSKFHRSDCIHVRGHETIEMTIEEAQNKGYGECQVCRPLH